MFLILLLVHFFHNVGLAATLSHVVVPTGAERDLATCNCPSEQRTLWDIIWSCLATIFTCTWVSVHPNIPGPDDSEWKITKRRAGLMIWAILAPELVIYWAIRQWVGARQLADKYHQFNWTKTHGYYLQMGGFTLYEGESRVHVLNGDDLGDLFREGRIAFPTITEVEIQDRSKGDGLAKAITIIQTTWFVMQCIARHVQGLVITELEIITLAFATLNGIMYFFWWNKPLAIRCSTPVTVFDEPRPKQILRKKPKRTFWDQMPNPVDHLYGVYRHLYPTKIDFHKRWEFHWSWKVILASLWEFLDQHMINPVAEFCGFGIRDIDGSHYFTRTYTRYAHVMPTFTFHYQIAILVALIGNLFGAIHCIAWPFQFPSYVEGILWRTCSLIVLITPELLLLVSAVGDFRLHQHLLGSSSWIFEVLSRISFGIILPFYTIARLILIAEAFATLRVLTPAALAEVDWTSFIPHI